MKSTLKVFVILCNLESDGSENEDVSESEELQREIGDAGLDNVVDERQWNDEEDSLDKEAEEKYEDSGAQGDRIQGESHTRDGEGDEGSENSSHDGKAKENMAVESFKDVNDFQEETSNDKHRNVEMQQEPAEAEESDGDDLAEEVGDEEGDLGELGDQGDNDHHELPEQMDIEERDDPENDGEDAMSTSFTHDNQVRPISLFLFSLKYVPGGGYAGRGHGG